MAEGLIQKKYVAGKPVLGKGKILLMDDEEEIRRVVGQMLRYIGYEVEFSRDGAEAIERYKNARQLGDPCHAVILDLMIPGGMGGKEAIQELLKIDPEVKGIVSSGYFDEPVMSNFEEYGFRGVLAKPYSVKELGEALHMVINAQPHAARTEMTCTPLSAVRGPGIEQWAESGER
jgi:CheY-like chemotaxis protein